MRAVLQTLRAKDPRSILVVRKIAPLGFDSPGILGLHFARYGRVAEVLVAHSHSRARGEKRPRARLRASCLGFVVMDSRAGAEAVFEDGPQQTITTTTLLVERYKPHSFSCTADDGTTVVEERREEVRITC